MSFFSICLSLFVCLSCHSPSVFFVFLPPECSFFHFLFSNFRVIERGYISNIIQYEPLPTQVKLLSLFVFVTVFPFLFLFLSFLIFISFYFFLFLLRLSFSSSFLSFFCLFMFVCLVFCLFLYLSFSACLSVSLFFFFSKKSAHDISFLLIHFLMSEVAILQTVEHLPTQVKQLQVKK